MILTMAMAIDIPTIMTMAITAGNALITPHRLRSITPARHAICRHRLKLCTALRRFGVNRRRHSTGGGVRLNVRLNLGGLACCIFQRVGVPVRGQYC